MQLAETRRCATSLYETNTKVTNEVCGWKAEAVQWQHVVWHNFACCRMLERTPTGGDEGKAAPETRVDDFAEILDELAAIEASFLRADDEGFYHKGRCCDSARCRTVGSGQHLSVSCFKCQCCGEARGEGLRDRG